jgi:hypothetical protein
MGYSLLFVNNLETVMRTKPGANSAMGADDGLSCFVVEINSSHNASAHATAAADAFFFLYQNASARSFFKCRTPAHFYTRRLFASQANYCNK